MTTPEGPLGMGFRDFVLFNQAMLGEKTLMLVDRARFTSCKRVERNVFPESS
jgi:hypothetical protein